MTLEAFESLWATHQAAVTRFIRFRIDSPHDAEDVLQEVMTAACLNYPTLRDAGRFKPWVIGIAKNKCTDWLRRKYRLPELPLEAADRVAVLPRRFALTQDSRVEETLLKLNAQDQLLLHMCYWLELPQSEIARRLGVPIGTVKSRLHHAKERFRTAYPISQKGNDPMPTMMPKTLPAYTITPSPLPPFACKWEEMMGWFIVPKLGEKSPGPCMTSLSAAVQRPTCLK